VYPEDVETGGVFPGVNALLDPGLHKVSIRMYE